MDTRNFGGEIPAKQTEAGLDDTPDATMATLCRRWEHFRETPNARELNLLITDTQNLKQRAADSERPRQHAYATALLEALHHLSAETRPRAEDSVTIDGLIDMLSRQQDDLPSLQNDLEELEFVIEPRREKLIYITAPDQEWSQEIKAFLDDHGFRTEIAPDVETLNHKAEQTPPLAVVMDMAIDGGPLDDDGGPWSQFRRGRLRVPFLMASERVDFNARLAAIRCGGIRFFPKPLDRQALLNALQHLCGEQPEEPFRVLLVDDDAMLSEMYATVLEHEGFNVVCARDPHEAIRHLPELDPDLVVLDLYLPICSGIDLAHMIRQYPKFESTPIIFLSVESSLDVQLGCARLSGEEFLTKPVAPWRLLMVVESRARRSRILRQENLRLAERITYQAEHDALTGLPNRMLFKDRLQQALLRSERFATQSAVMMLDIDHFQQINDVYGHNTGDELLIHLAGQIPKVLRNGDTLSRPGGDEFLVLLPDLTNLDTAAQVATRLLQIVANIPPLGGNRLQISCSIGIAVSPHDGTHVEALLKHADTALYHAKRAGRADFAFFTASMGEVLTEQMRLETELVKALEQQQFLLHYQPVVSVTDGQIEGAEALIRWKHPSRGMVPPMQFIPLAERRGLIGAISEWVLETACAQLAEWRRLGHTRLTMAINLSAAQLKDQAFSDLIQRTLDRHQLAPGLLTVELTETMLMENHECAVAQLNQLRQLGVRIAIDDFGTGYSSLSYMKKLPVNKLKIDKSFLGNIDQLEDRQIVRAIVLLAHSLRMDVVAEGVETESQLDFLRKQRCDFAQGYLISKPVEASAFIEYLNAKE